MSFRKIEKFSQELEKLEQELEGLTVHKVPEDIEVSEGVKAFCPFIVRNCVEVDCGRCTTLDEYSPADKVWGCWECTGGFELWPFWHDGYCDNCGEYSIVLIMAIPKLDDLD